MSQIIICPACKSQYEYQINLCTKCHFPFEASEKEKAIFIGQQLVKRSRVSGTKHKIKKARNILWVIGIANFLFALTKYTDDTFFITNTILSIIFIAFGFLTYKKPYLSILIPLTLLLLSYILSAMIEPTFLLRGIIWKIFFIFTLLYALLSIKEANKIKKESSFLSEHKY